MATSILDTTNDLLNDALDLGLSLREIAGSDVEYEWLKKFAAGKIGDPGVTRIEGLKTRLHTVVRAARRRHQS